jgi:hypothetical protein
MLPTCAAKGRHVSTAITTPALAGQHTLDDKSRLPFLMLLTRLMHTPATHPAPITLQLWL